MVQNSSSKVSETSAGANIMCVKTNENMVLS